MSKALRILVLNDCLPPDSDGGQELSALQIGEALRDRGHDVEFVCSEWRTSFKGDKVERPELHRILKYAEIRARTESKLPMKLESLRAVERKLNIGKENRKRLAAFLATSPPFDIAFVFGVLRIGIGTVRAFTDAKIPVVWSISDIAIPVHFGMPSETKLYGLVFKTIGRSAHRIERTVDFSRMIFVSEFVREQMAKAGIEPSQSAVVPRAVGFEPVDIQRTQKQEPPVIFVASRLSPSRGVHVVIEAATLLAQKRPDLKWILRIAGDGPKDYVDALKATAANLGSHVDFLGQIPNREAVEHMKGSTIVVNPTVEVEGFSRANIEALACGVALVGSDIPSYRELLGDTGCGVVYEPGNSHALSRVLEDLLDSPALVSSLVHKGIERIRSRYLMSRVIGEIEEQLELAMRPAELLDLST